MAAAFTCDEKVTIEHLVGTKDPVYGTDIQSWVPLLVRYWANVQDALPSRSEQAGNGVRVSARPARLRMQGAGAVTTEMRAVMHNRGDLVMQIIAGPALLNDRVHYEFQLEAYQDG